MELSNRADIRITAKYILYAFASLMILGFLLFLLKPSTGWGGLHSFPSSPIVAGVFACMMFYAVREVVEKGAKSGGVELEAQRYGAHF